jgi:hypothetical protein
MGLFILTTIALIICVAINIYDAKQYKKHKYYESITKSNTNDKCDGNKTIKETNINTNEWQIINKHGFSINKMYEANPYYNPNKIDSKKLKRTREYEEWQEQMLRQMRLEHIKSIDSMHVDPNKPMKIEIEFKLVNGSDTDNPIKSFIDTLVKYYGLKDDNNFYVINSSRDFTPATNYANGRIKFRITNIDKDDKGQITEVKIIKEKIEVPKTIIKEVEVVKESETYKTLYNIKEKQLKELQKDNEKKNDEINKLKNQLKTVSKETKEPKTIIKEVVKEVEVIREVAKGDNRYKMLYEKYKTAYEALKDEVDKSKDVQINYNQSKFVQTDAYKQQLERIKQMNKSY